MQRVSRTAATTTTSLFFNHNNFRDTNNITVTSCIFYLQAKHCHIYYCSTTATTPTLPPTYHFYIKMDSAQLRSTTTTTHYGVVGHSPADSASSAVTKRRTSSSSSHPAIVHSMISSNLLKNCHEVQDMVAQCHYTNDKDSFMCKAAHSFLSSCQ
jgi:hypothetical protein